MKTAKFLTVVLGAASLFVLTAPAFGQDRFTEQANEDRLKRIEKDLREVRSIVLQAKATGHPVEIRTASSDDEMAAVQTKLDDIEQTVRTLTGQIETLGHDLDVEKSASAANQTQNAALSDRLSKLEAQVAALAAPPPAAVTPTDGSAGGAAASEPGPTSAADANAAYLKARRLMLNGDYPAAADAFQSVLDTYPSGPSTPAANYWLGWIKYAQGDFQGAAGNMVGAIHDWPKTVWAPDAMVKLSLSMIQLNKRAEACSTLNELDRHYPKAPAADKSQAAAARVKAGCR